MAADKSSWRSGRFAGTSRRAGGLVNKGGGSITAAPRPLNYWSVRKRLLTCHQARYPSRVSRPFFRNPSFSSLNFSLVRGWYVLLPRSQK
jgi:hypothetical protein